MTKPKLCQRTKGCNKPRMKKPGNSTIYFKGCIDCEIQANLSKIRTETIKDKEELNKARQTLKKRTPRELFYSSAAWRNFSQYVLLFYADESMMVRCATNPSLEYKINDKRICVGHFIKVFEANSSNYSTAFDFRNVLPQSDQENRFKNGNEPEMEKAINRIHGEGTSDIIKQKKHEPFRLDKYTLSEISKEYLKKKKELLTERGWSDPWKSKR